MTLNASGPISLAGTTAGQSIEIENGGNGTTQISLNDTAVRTLAGGSATATGSVIIMPTNFYGKSNQFSFTVSASQTNYCLRASAVSGGWNQSSKLVVTINSGVIISSNATGTPALKISGSFPNGITVTNNGTIVGMGGNAGNGGSSGTSGGNGSGGGTALVVQSSVTFNNVGVIAGGGGGGGGGSGVTIGFDCGHSMSTGGGGGGGGRSSNAANSSGGTQGNNSQCSGYNPSPGGAGTYSSAGSGGSGGRCCWSGHCGIYILGGNGGNGGTWGASGCIGTGGSFGAGYNSSGGSGGKATCGAGTYITWTGTGTRYGSVS